MVAPRLRSGRKRKMFSAFDMATAAGDVPLGGLTPGGENCPVVTAPIVFAAPVLKIFIPSCFDAFRSTLAKRTFKRICAGGGGTLTYNRFTTLPALEAIWTARSELARSFTVPRRKTRLFSEEIVTFCPGRVALSSRRIEVKVSSDAARLG